MHRRTFLKNTTLASTAMLAPNFLRFGRQAVNRSGKIFIVIQLSGGNDGLNTIVPFRNDVYYRERPTLAIAANEVHPLSDEQGLHPSLAPLRELFDQGHFSIVNSVGYPNPDRSHFRSMDIWHTASDSDIYLKTGWLGRYLDHQCEGCPNHEALEMGNGLSLALKGDERRGFVMSQPRVMERANRQPLLQYVAQQTPHDHEHEQAAYLYKTLVDTQESTGYLLEHSNGRRTRADFPDGPFGRDLRQVAELILAGCESRIYYVSLGSFDTHANQQGQQARLFEQYAQGLQALAAELQSHQLWQDTLVMTFSEFGRRVAQNGSRGTDHGTANNLFLAGGSLRQAGIYNAPPLLTDLDAGDLRYAIDFRQVYANVLNDWLGADAGALLGGDFAGLSLI
ncbi:MAG: DUF1501 domain-containing protein [Lewinella sp.]|nr:DUF1501 domain-containing protein [Lewinella sp.]